MCNQFQIECFQYEVIFIHTTICMGKVHPTPFEMLTEVAQNLLYKIFKHFNPE